MKPCFKNRKLIAWLALDALETCEAAGLAVPEEVAIVGAGNSLLAVDAMHTPISSVDVNMEATGYRAQRTEVSVAEAQRFLIQAQTASKSPRVFRTNLYLGVIAEALADTRKYIVPASAANEVIQLNFEEKLRPELFDLGPDKKEK